MAIEKKSEQSSTVEDRLRALYKLQTILTQIDKIKTIRGELPLEVRDLEDNIVGLKQRIQNYNDDMDALRQQIVGEENKKQDCKAKIDNYNEQLKEIRNSREFDMLTKEVEFQSLEIELCDKHINEYKRMIDNKKVDINNTLEKLGDLEHILSEKKSELDEIVSETRQEEEGLREQAKAIEPQIDDFTLKAFKRIRKNARNGLGIVYVQRNACGGCFNRIPPQRQMEIKMHKKVIVCEYCGRIIIDPELAGVDASAAE